MSCKDQRTARTISSKITGGEYKMSRVYVLAALFCMLIPAPVLAEPGFANSIYAPYVKKGVTEFEASGGMLTGGRRSGDGGVILEVEHGFTDHLDLSVFAEIERGGAKTEVDSVGIEAV